MIPSKMQAAVYRGIDNIQIEEVEIPTIGPGEALVRLNSCGVCGTDLKKIHYGLVEPPRIFGHEMAGEIVALGNGVLNWKLGDRVAVMHHVPCCECYYCSRRDYAQCPKYKETGTTSGFVPAGGGFAQYIRVMDWVVRRGMVLLPQDATEEEAAFIEPLNTVLKGIERAKLRAGDTVLIAGQGQIGLLFTLALKLRSHTVLTTDLMPHRRQTSVHFGADAAFDPAHNVLASECKARTAGRGVDFAVVAVPGEEAVRQAMESVRPGSTVMLFAHTRLKDDISVDAGAVCMLEKSLIGSYSSDIDLQDEAARLIFEREIDVRKLITHRFPLSQTAEAIRLASSPTDGSLKVMVVHP